jgi:hypothetical protein
MTTKPHPLTVTLPLPVLDDAAAVLIYNFLCDLVDRFDTHYGEQICHFYALQDPASLNRPPSIDPEDIPF